MAVYELRSGKQSLVIASSRDKTSCIRIEEVNTESESKKDDIKTYRVYLNLQSILEQSKTTTGELDLVLVDVNGNIMREKIATK